MVEGIGRRYTDEQRFWRKFEDELKIAWVFYPPKQVTELPDPIYRVNRRTADIYDY